jgi:hypothetical protein
MIPAASVLKFLYLANHLGLKPSIDYNGGNFIIRYSYPDRYRNEQIVIDEGTSVDDCSDWDNNSFYSELENLIGRYTAQQNDPEDEERQQLLSKLSDREKELLGLL